VLIGRPNVGKSTLHLAIVSPRPQTTRNRILGVISEPGTQLCLIDVPGVHKAKGLLNRAMVQAALGAMTEVDVVLYLAEAGWPSDAAPGDENVDVVGAFHRDLLNDVKKAGKPAILVLTKIDLVPKHLLLPIMEAWSKAFDWQEVFPLSGLTGENTERFINVVRKYLPEGDPLFAPDMITDQPERGLAAEFIREQVFLQTHDEIPYGAAVVIDEFDESERPDVADEELPTQSLAAEPEAINEAVEHAQDGEDDEAFDEDLEEEEPEEEGTAPTEEGAALAPPALRAGLVRIEASIVVERETHKGIVIGRRGERIRQIGTAARMHIERLLGTRVWLGLHVRVIPGWTEKKSFLAEFGYLGQ
jgi:GTP-binding protein Era